MSEEFKRCCGCRHIYAESETVWVSPMEKVQSGLITKYGTCPKCGDKVYSDARPLFIPLKAKFFAAFANGSKDTEYRVRDNRWNMETCRIGRRVVLSCGYGKKHRLHGVVVACHYDNLPTVNVPGWVECYGRHSGPATCIKIQLLAGGDL